MKNIFSIPTDEQPSASNQAGFTIVELMIASLVFSVILVVITVGVVRFTNGYYRGINSSTTQSAAQNAIDSVAQAVQFSRSGTSGGAAGFFCAGSKVFVYSPGKQFSGTFASTDRGLYMLDNTSAGCSNVVNPAGGTELLGKGMRVVYASVTQPDPLKALWSIKLKIAYGDNDLLCSESASAGSCTNNAVLADTDLTKTDVKCKSSIGSQFCSVIELSTVAEQRLGN